MEALRLYCEYHFSHIQQIHLNNAVVNGINHNENKNIL